jgi:gas vesicle protein
MADNNSKLVWFVAGVAIGSTVALLYAPQSGRVTRRYLGRTAKRSGEAVSDAVSEAGRDLMEKGRDLYEKGRKVADDAAELFERGRRIVEG